MFSRLRAAFQSCRKLFDVKISKFNLQCALNSTPSKGWSKWEFQKKIQFLLKGLENNFISLSNLLGLARSSRWWCMLEPKIVARFLERSWLKSLSAGSLQFKVQPLYRRHSAPGTAVPWTVFLVWNSHKESMRKFSYLLNHYGFKSILQEYSKKMSKQTDQKLSK